uniref:Impact N-terminal domain-containing protein n=1 Tax=Guillardia theta TaxID=55529 RepID=A0A7S4K960_GUITH|mmetsp:Transcript_22089/g.72753  ORF Transcript_22089/g.72753 Transcript_22089/m.72753 type:complete len:236 (+) Transcript_22089:1-708(+)
MRSFRSFVLGRFLSSKKSNTRGSRNASPRMMASEGKSAWFTPAEETSAEIKVKNSRFIGTLAYTPSVEDARKFIADMKVRYPDARHNCYAFKIGDASSSIEGMSDDGEPSGTAGRPILNVIAGSSVTDCTLVVTRYFGGTKLGTGGLVKAYTECAQVTLLGSKTVERVFRVRLAVSGVDYGLYAKLRSSLEALGGIIEDENFGEDVAFKVNVEEEIREQAIQVMMDETAGKATIS